MVLDSPLAVILSRAFPYPNRMTRLRNGIEHISDTTGDNDMKPILGLLKLLLSISIGGSDKLSSREDGGQIGGQVRRGRMSTKSCDILTDGLQMLIHHGPLTILHPISYDSTSSVA